MSSGWCPNGLITGCLRQTRQKIWVDKKKAKPRRFRRSMPSDFQSLDRMSEEKGVLKEAEVEKVTVAKVTESKFSDPNHLK